MIIRSDKYRRYGKLAVGGISVNYNRKTLATHRDSDIGPMELSELTPEQLGMILFRVNNQNRRSAKKYLHSLGAPSDSIALDAAIKLAQDAEQSQKIAKQIKHQREFLGGGLDAVSKSEKDRLIQKIVDVLEAKGMDHIQFAELVAMEPKHIAQILDARRELSLRDFCRMAISLNLDIDVAEKK